MKKLFLSLLAIFATALLSYAQPLCEPCQHTVSPEYTYMHVICSTGPLPASCDPNLAGQDIPFLFVIVTYRVVSCPGANDQLLVNGVVLVDDRQGFEAACPGITSGCGAPPFPLSSAYILQQLQNGIGAAVSNLGLNTDIDVIYKGSCNSMVRVTFPEKVYMLQGRGDAPGVDTVWINPESEIWQTVPCNDVCCKVKYKFEIVTAADGETTMTWKADSWEGADLSCPNAPLPDYNTSNRRLTAYTPGTPPQEVHPAVMEQTSCSVFCDHMGSPPPPPDIVPGAPGFSTDVAEIKDQLPLRLTADPTLCSNYIRFSTNKPITRVAVYDISGKRVIDTNTLANNELLTSGLKNGVYYVQVYFSENEVKTIKIMKQ